MAWLLLTGIVIVLALRLARRRRSRFMVLPSESISTIHVELSKRQPARTRAALEAATATLR